MLARVQHTTTVGDTIGSSQKRVTNVPLHEAALTFHNARLTHHAVLSMDVAATASQPCLTRRSFELTHATHTHSQRARSTGQAARLRQKCLLRTSETTQSYAGPLPFMSALKFARSSNLDMPHCNCDAIAPHSSAALLEATKGQRSATTCNQRLEPVARTTVAAVAASHRMLSHLPAGTTCEAVGDTIGDTIGRVVCSAFGLRWSGLGTW